MSVTIYDVAKEAGVSIATVSRVVNQHSGVSSQTKSKVLKAMGQLQYHHHQTAVAPAKGINNAIGLMIPNIRNPFYAQVAAGIYYEALNRGVNVITIILGREKLDTGLRLLSQNSVDGLLAMDISKEQLTKISDVVENVVLVGNDLLDCNTNCVVVDNFAGIQMMMKHLIASGHKRIALLSEKSDYNDIQDRIRAYQYCMEEEGLAEFRQVVYVNGSGIEEGESIAIEWMKNRDGYTAVIASNDLLAIGFIKALKQANWNIPQEISVAGFDGIWLSSITDPSLSSVVQPMFEMGSAAVALIMDILQCPAATPRKIVLNPSLQIGGTTNLIEGSD